MAPKSNRSYAAYKKALDFVEMTGSRPVPLHLRSSKTELMKSIGYGKGYEYPHDFAKGWVDQSYLPEGLEMPKLYEPSKLGFEKTMLEYEAWRKVQKPTSEK